MRNYWKLLFGIGLRTILNSIFYGKHFMDSVIIYWLYKYFLWIILACNRDFFASSLHLFILILNWITDSGVSVVDCNLSHFLCCSWLLFFNVVIQTNKYHWLIHPCDTPCNDIVQLLVQVFHYEQSSKG